MIDEKRRMMEAAEQRNAIIMTAVLFVVGLSVILSYDFGNAIFRPIAPFILADGLTLGVITYLVLQRIVPSSRPCTNCHQPVPLGALTCPTCGQPVPTRRPGAKTG